MIGQFKNVQRSILFLLTLMAAILLASGCGTKETAKQPAAKAGETKAPAFISWTAYDIGSTGYIQSSAIANALKQADGVTVRIIPAGTDVSRLSPVRTGSINYAATGAGAYYAFEGLDDFATIDWGPQDLGLVWMCIADEGVGIAVTKESGIKTLADMKGKRVAWIPGAPAINIITEAFMAFGNLTWKDVVKVEFPSYGASLKGLVEGTVDAAHTRSNAAGMYELASSPRGFKMLESPKDDKAGWDRLQKVAPYILPFSATVGAGGISAQNPIAIGNYPYPVLVAYANQKEDSVYQMAKMIHKNFDLYKGANSSMPGWGADKLLFQWRVPYHPGAVKYFKEQGWWKEEHQKHNDQLTAYYKNLKKTFDDAVSEAADKQIKSGDFAKFWLGKRQGIAGK